MNVLLISPCINNSKTFDQLGLRYIASSLQQQNNKTRVCLQNDRDDFVGISEAIKGFSPDVIGIYCSTPLRNQALKVAEISKNMLPSARIIVGGPHATLAPGDLMNHRSIDYLIRGEGEIALNQLINMMEHGHIDDKVIVSVSGLVYRARGSIKSNPAVAIDSIDLLPFPISPDDKLSFVVKTEKTDEEYHSILSSRGCPYACSFCSSSEILGRAIRRRSIANIGQELGLYKGREWMNITFLDDTLTVAPGYFAEIVSVLKEKRMRWIAQSRVDIHDKVDFSILKESGCEQLEFGVESGSERVLGYLSKRTNIKDILLSFQKCRESGIRTFANFIIGSPHEREEDLKKTFRLLEEIEPTTVGLWIATPYPGTKMYENARKEGLLNYDGEDLFSIIETMNYKGIPGFNGYFKSNRDLFARAQEFVDKSRLRSRIFKPRNNYSSFSPTDNHEEI